MLRRLVIGFWPLVMGGMPGEYDSSHLISSFLVQRKPPALHIPFGLTRLLPDSNLIMPFPSHLLTYIPVPAAGS